MHRVEVFIVADHFRGHLGKSIKRRRPRSIIFIEEPHAILSHLLEQSLCPAVCFAGYAADRGWIEIVVGKEDVAKTHRMKLVGLFDNLIVQVHPRSPAFSDPHRTEAAILRTAGNGLDRAHQILTWIQKVPAGFDHLLARHAATVVHALKTSIQSIPDDVAPDQIAAALYDGVSAHLQGLVGKNRRMNTSNDDRCPAFLRFRNHPISGPAISRVDADAYDVAWTNLIRIEARDRFVNYHRIADQVGRCRARDHEKPPRGNHAIANSSVRRIYENDFAHAGSLFCESFIESKVSE